MASVRKKQDERNLKILRELVSAGGNKHCFDCGQRGPTYVNVTIGSFVCTKCSGMLRGLTPPHRVKSISMASFTAEEIDLVRSRGNDHCRRTWLALHDGDATPSGDEQQIKDFMVDKYEKKRYFVEASPSAIAAVATSSPIAAPMGTAVKNNGLLHYHHQPQQQQQQQVVVKAVPRKSVPQIVKGSAFGEDFVADFSSADIFNSSSSNSNAFNTINGLKSNSSPITNNAAALTMSQSQPSFANFDSNPIFNSSSMPTAGALSNLSTSMTMPNMSRPQAPPEDRYAALKDLDMALKSQQQQQQPPPQPQPQPQPEEWGLNNGHQSSGSSLYGSPSSKGGSLFGSPPQHQFNAFATMDQSSNTAAPSNPFWSVVNGSSSSSAGSSNPFRSNGATNGFSQQPHNQQPFFPSSQSINFPIKGGGSAASWANQNPFALGSNQTNGTHSSNPFL